MSNIIDSIKLSGVTYDLVGSGGGVPENVFTAYTASTDSRIGEDEEVTAAALNALDEKIDSISGGGNPTVEVTQAEYDAMVTAGTVSADTYYIITDAQAGDLTNYYTKTETDNAITAATSTKQDTLVSGTNIKTINNESLLGSGNIDIQGGGGKAIEAGRGISITTGETADTVSFNLPISAGTGSNSITIGYTKNKASGNYCLAGGEQSSASTFWAFSYGASVKANGSATAVFGQNNTASSSYSFLCGYRNNTKNDYEVASGEYNVSNTGSTNADKTLFSVGNGTADNARHNAFEIRQNGDIYLSSGGTDIKLQDYLGGSSITVDTALDSGSTNPVENRVIYNKIDEVEQVTAAGLNAVNDALGGLSLVKLTQAEYDALSGNTDANTLYVIVNPSWHVIPSGSTISTLRGSKIRVPSSLTANEGDNVAFGTTSNNVYSLVYVPSMGGWCNWQTWTNGSSTLGTISAITPVDGYYEIDFGEELNGFGSYTDSSATTTTDVAPFEFEIYY